MLQALLCLFRGHLWLERGAYRRICKRCPAVEYWDPELGWVREE